MSSPRQTRASKTPQGTRSSVTNRSGIKMGPRKSEKHTSTGDHSSAPLKDITGGEGCFLWNDETEAILFRNVLKLKPVGPMKHWKMMLIRERVSNAIDHVVTSEDIWFHLSNFYDMKAVEELETVDKNENFDFFTLPKSYLDLKFMKEGATSKDRVRKNSSSTFGRGDSDVDEEGGPSTPSSVSKKSVPNSPKADDDSRFPFSPDVHYSAADATHTVRKSMITNKPTPNPAKRSKMNDGGARRRTSSESTTKGEARKNKGSVSIKSN